MTNAKRSSGAGLRQGSTVVNEIGSQSGAIGNENGSRSVDANDSQKGVGARQLCPPPPAGGGGYPDICTASGAGLLAPARGADDPRLDELRRIGLPRIWLEVALHVGFDAFMGVWHVLMREGHVDDRNRVVVPNFERYLRYQRNQLIRDLAANGFSAESIRHLVMKQTGKDMDAKHIRKTMAAARVSLA